MADALRSEQCAGADAGRGKPRPYTGVATARMAIAEMAARRLLLQFVKGQANVIFGERGGRCSRTRDVIEFG
jgi:hypothetical protein